jgi:hypothetical protein
LPQSPDDTPPNLLVESLEACRAVHLCDFVHQRSRRIVREPTPCPPFNRSK